MSTKKFLDSSGLAHFWDKAKEYIGDNTIPKVNDASGNLAQIDSSGNVVDSGASKSSFALSEQGIPSGGTQNQVLAKTGSGNYNVSWKTPSYSDLDSSSKPKINGVSLDGNKDSSTLGLASKVQGEKADTVFSNYLKAGESSGASSVTGFDPFVDTVHNSVQALSPTQQEQVRQNINAQQTITNVVAISTEDAYANFSGGTLTLGLPKGKDAVNPFKGWYDSSSNLPSNPVVGDYAYVKGAESTDPAAIYECTTAGYWSDSDRTVDTSNVQIFASGEEVNETYIDDTHLVNPVSNSLARAEDITDLNKMYAEKVYNVTDIATYVKDGIINPNGKYTSGTNGKIYRLSLKAEDKVVVYMNHCSTAYAALSLSNESNPSSFSLHLVGYGSSQAGYYSYTAVNNINLFITLETGVTCTVSVKRENEFDFFGFKHYTYGENAVKDYVGTNTSDTTIWGSGFFTSTGSITSGSGYHYSKDYIPVMQGSYAQAGMVLSGNAKICYYKEDKSFLSAVSSGNATASTLRVIPSEAAYMRFCMSNTDTSRLSWIYQNEGMQVVDVPEINTLNSEVATMKQTLSGVDKSIDNNLLNESNKIDGWSVKTSTDGTNYTTDNSLYGQPNIRYQIPVDNSAKVLHVRFRFKFTQPLAETSSSTNHNLLIVGSTDSYRAALRQNAFNYNTSNYILQRTQYFVVQQSNNVSDITLDNSQFKQLEGAIAYSLEYKGTSYSSAVNYKLQLTSTAINVYDSDGTTVLETISIDTDELVSSVVDKVNNTSNYLKAVPYEVDGTKYTDCMNGSVKFPLCVSSSGSRPWMINKLYDEKWHTFECVLDYNTLKSYTNIDGATVYRAITEPTSKTLYIGGAVNFSAYKMVPIVCRDLHIGYGYEDAEIITYPNNVSGTLTRLISNESPYLMIFEGHGIENKMNKDMPTGSDTYMATSTDTLRTVFDALRSKGFVPISWQDIVKWKKYGGKLPKRCYTLMFDDWRLENYMNLDLRKPFVEYGVKPGLAVITSGEDGAGDTESRNTQITIDGQTWTVGECFDAIIKGGWYPCSHTKNHTVISNVSDMGLFSLLKDCIYSCDKLGIYDDVIVYPTGSATQHKKLMMMVSGFAIGVQVAVNGFNSLASLDFNLIRNEIGSRKNITNILAQIV